MTIGIKGNGIMPNKALVLNLVPLRSTRATSADVRPGGLD